MLEDLNNINIELGNIRWRISKDPGLTDSLKKELEYLINIESRIQDWIYEAKEKINEFIGENE